MSSSRTDAWQMQCRLLEFESGSVYAIHRGTFFPEIGSIIYPQKHVSVPNLNSTYLMSVIILTFDGIEYNVRIKWS